MLLNNRYQIIRTLGSGGFGETFLAEDTQMPSRRLCVIKQLRPIQDNQQVYQLVRERFGREAAILEELGDGSCQIPSLYAYFNEHGQFYLVQEYIEGKTLTQMLQEKGLMDENSVKEILISILPVLEYVHSKGIVHRDIKPENILIDINGQPVLIDFGAVKETLGTIMTPSGNATKSIVIGTPGFMATEQSVGRPMFVSDIYSLGLTAIYLLTGKMPQELNTDPASGKVLWRQYVPNIQDNFANILDKAIGFNARDRFANATAMMQAVQSGAINTTSETSHSTAFPDTLPPAVTLPPQTHLNTVAIAPPSVVASSHQGNGKGILLGSLIVGSLIGTSIVVGLALNRQPKQTKIITQQPQPATSPIRNLESLNQPQTTPTVAPTVTPTVTPTVQPNTQPNFTFPPATEPNNNLNNSQVEKVEEPLTAPQKPQITNPAPNLEIPQQTQLSPPGDIAQPPIEQPSPAQTVENYYLNINQGQYKTAWNQLSQQFKDNKRLHPKGYFSYLNWWRGKVESVNIEQVKILEASVDTAVVDTSLNYLMKNGRIIPNSVRFTLSWDAQNRRWVVKDAN